MKEFIGESTQCRGHCRGRSACLLGWGVYLLSHAMDALLGYQALVASVLQSFVGQFSPNFCNKFCSKFKDH